MANRILGGLRVSLSSLLISTAVIGLSLAALTHPGAWWLLSMQCAVVVSIAVCAALAAAAQNVRDRAFPLAFIATVLVHSYLRLGINGESPIAEMVWQLMPYGDQTFPSINEWALFRVTLTPVISLLLGLSCGWLAFSLSKSPANDEPA
jgi:hypothetical protein